MLAVEKSIGGLVSFQGSLARSLGQTLVLRIVRGLCMGFSVAGCDSKSGVSAALARAPWASFAGFVYRKDRREG